MLVFIEIRLENTTHKILNKVIMTDEIVMLVTTPLGTVVSTTFCDSHNNPAGCLGYQIFCQEVECFPRVQIQDLLGMVLQATFT